jgi:hypothetical protein
MAGDRSPGRPAGGDGEDPTAAGATPWDAALARLEDVLLSVPFDRTLPGLPDLLERARVPLSFVQQDDRALKLIHEAVVARPLSTPDAVARHRGQVELMTLEVEVLTTRLSDPGADAQALAEARRRLTQIRRELQRLRDVL